MTSSCIIRHFEHYAELGPEEKELLASLEKAPKSFPKGSLVWQQGMDSDYFFTVHSGWACSLRNMENGSRQVLDFYVPGDVIGLREFAFRRRISNMMTITDAIL